MDRSPAYLMHGQTRFLGHEPCPECQKAGHDRHGNNLGRWSDKHGFCFSCRYFEPGDVIKRISDFQKPAMAEGAPEVLPADASRTISHVALQWLSKYDILREEVIRHDLQWSEFNQWLLFPYKAADGTLLAWQARNFHPNEDKPKWRTYGRINDVLHILGWEEHGESPICVVEDIVSAIKVSRVTRAMPLFGSTFSLSKFARLKHLTDRLVIWLDADKYVNSLKFTNQAQLIGIQTASVFTDKDPKECTMDQIKVITRI